MTHSGFVRTVHNLVNIKQVQSELAYLISSVRACKINRNNIDRKGMQAHHPATDRRLIVSLLLA